MVALKIRLGIAEVQEEAPGCAILKRPDVLHTVGENRSFTLEFGRNIRSSAAAYDVSTYKAYKAES